MDLTVPLPTVSARDAKEVSETAARALGWSADASDPAAYWLTYHLTQCLRDLYRQGRSTAAQAEAEGEMSPIPSDSPS